MGGSNGAADSRRARMLDVLATRAGRGIFGFVTTLQSMIWFPLSRPSTMLQPGFGESYRKVSGTIRRPLRKSSSPVPGHFRFLRPIVADDAGSVPRLSYEMFTKLVNTNPIEVFSMTRRSLLDAFFIVGHVPSIQQCSEIACTSPFDPRITF
jgi:hypothetical protein